ncbi:MAG: N-formylglutamate amidohydrolase, partial [Fimbriimonadaceae bacterium]|nr:N-formylglutamate amidohydrolase [Alphaproteobacteria bacterium]
PGDGSSLYPGQTTTGLVPLETFAGEPLYLAGQEPDAAEIARRKARYWQPYHQKIEDTLAAIKARHGFAILFDCHSIKSEVPRLFEGKLSDLNLGTADGASCAPALRQTLRDAMSDQSDLTVTIDGRFKGGFITRNYGRPDKKTHAYQIEHSTSIYMDEKPDFAWNEDKASAARPILKDIFKAVMRWAYLQSAEC